MSRSIPKVVTLALLVGALVVAIPAPSALAADRARTLLVPSGYPTIQAAIDAARPGDRIRVRAGTYVEQVQIDKNVTIRGAGRDKTIIKAPSTLQPNDAEETAIVDITGGASVQISRLTVAGPGSGTCDDGALTAGIRVRNEAHLDLRWAAVRNIHDTPFAACFRTANAIYVGDVPSPTASATIKHTQVTNYQGSGIVVLGFGSTAVISHSRVKGPGMAKGVSTSGIEFPVGSVGTIDHNVVSGNVCPPSDTSCGTDWFNQFQMAGITAGGWGPGTVIKDNLLFDNQVGMLLGESDVIRGNRMIDNDFFGLVLADGEFKVEDGRIQGGGGGVWAIATSADTHITLDDVRFRRLGGPKIEKVECCGFSATVDIED
jgi:hypothetical protein